jgi:nitroreductase
MVAMETWDAIKSRRNVREYDGRTIADDDLDRILEAGRRAPSSRNWQPWDFVVVTDRPQLQELSQVWQFARHVAGSAATIALVAPEPSSQDERDWIQYDFGQATMSMMIAAADLGIGAGHASVRDQKQAREVLRLPADHFCAYLIALGYPRRPLRPIRQPNRRPFEDVVHRGHW